jgi:DNA-binding HxlR family transcriptional regulator
MAKNNLDIENQSKVKDGFNAAIELFHKRWTMRVLWELRKGPVTFRELQSACAEVSSSVLNVRLSELRKAQLLEHTPGEGYVLTPWGKELLVAMRPLALWAGRWSEATSKVVTTPI